MHRAGIRKPLLMTAGRAVQGLPVSPHIQKLKSKAEHWCDPSAWKHSPEPVSMLWRKACPRGGIQYEGGHSKVTCLALRSDPKRSHVSFEGQNVFGPPLLAEKHGRLPSVRWHTQIPCQCGVQVAHFPFGDRYDGTH